MQKILFQVAVFLEESYYVWNSQLRALDDANGRIWAFLEPNVKDQVGRLFNTRLPPYIF